MVYLSPKKKSDFKTVEKKPFAQNPSYFRLQKSKFDSRKYLRSTSTRTSSNNMVSHFMDHSPAISSPLPTWTLSTPSSWPFLLPLELSSLPFYCLYWFSAFLFSINQISTFPSLPSHLPTPYLSLERPREEEEVDNPVLRQTSLFESLSPRPLNKKARLSMMSPQERFEANLVSLYNAKRLPFLFVQSKEVIDLITDLNGNIKVPDRRRIRQLVLSPFFQLEGIYPSFRFSVQYQLQVVSDWIWRQTRYKNYFRRHSHLNYSYDLSFSCRPLPSLTQQLYGRLVEVEGGRSFHWHHSPLVGREFQLSYVHPPSAPHHCQTHCQKHL